MSRGVGDALDAPCELGGVDALDALVGGARAQTACVRGVVEGIAPILVARVLQEVGGSSLASGKSEFGGNSEPRACRASPGVA